MSHEPTTNPGKIIRLALLGNPNTGKTTLFNALTGLKHRVGNYPGVTVDIKKGSFTHQGTEFEILDIPGTYSLAPRSPDELISVELVLGLNHLEPKPDVLLVIADASNLERNLYLATQAFETGISVVLALSMMDLAEKAQIRVDAKSLSRQLGIPVVPIHSNKRIGLEELKQSLLEAAREKKTAALVPFPNELEDSSRKVLGILHESGSLFLARRLLLETDGFLSRNLLPLLGDGLKQAVEVERQSFASKGINPVSIEAKVRYGWIREIISPCVTKPSVKPVTWTDKVDRLLTHRIWGMVFFFLIMFGMFQALFTLAKPLMDLIDEGKAALGGILGDMIAEGMFRSLVVDGLLEGVGGVLVFLPQIAILFCMLAILEDCGYMARAAFLMDRVMAKCGLSGKSFIPMLSSVACAVPGVLATRVIEDRRDRLATILVAPLMSCSARLPVYSLMIGAFLTEGYPDWFPGLILFCMYLIGFILAPLGALLLKRTFLKGQGAPFLMELPTYKRPSFRMVWARVIEASWSFIRRAGTLIAASMVIVWAVLYFPTSHPQGGTYPDKIAEAKTPEEKDALEAEWKKSSYLGRVGVLIQPVVQPLGWDWRIGVATLASFPAREVVVGTLGILFEAGSGEGEEVEQKLREILPKVTRTDDPSKPLFNIPVALSLMVFFALCSQCASTLVVIKQETRSWFWPVFTFVYMTLLAYVAALLTYQIGMMI